MMNYQHCQDCNYHPCICGKNTYSEETKEEKRRRENDEMDCEEMFGREKK